MKKLFSTTALAGVLALGVIGGAAAVPLSVTSASVTVYNFNNPFTGALASPTEQALPFAQLLGQNLKTSTFTYTGAISFNLPLNAGASKISDFIASGGGSVSSITGNAYSQQISTVNFDQTSLFKFTFSTAAAISGIITHDDGVSLFVSGNTTNDLLPTSAAVPTPPSDTAYSIGPGTYDLYYTEANGLPAQLNFNVATAVPEPATLALLGSGLVGVGLVGRRRKQDGSSTSV